MPESIVPEAFQTYPTHRFIGIVEAPAAADRVIAGLDRLGLRDDLWALTGHDATHALDPEGVEHGLWARVVRAVQKLGYEAQQLVEYDDAAQAGAWVLAVQLTPGAEQKDAVRDLFAAHGGRNLRFFGTFGIEDVLLNAPVTAAAVFAVEDAAARQEEAVAVAEIAADGAAARAMVSEGSPLTPAAPTG